MTALPSLLSTVEIAASFHALSDPLRVKILELLRQQEFCVCDLCDRLEVKQSKLSFHLKILREAGFLQSRQEGRWVYYRLNVAQFERMEQYLGTFSNLGEIPSAPCCQE